MERIIDCMDPATPDQTPAAAQRPKLGTLEVLRRMRKIVTPEEARKAREFLKELEKIEDEED
ncbi:MAG TPA: hypothetical protein VI893_09190 [Thermoplasmata archaeon]|nr:hypothetical protein [Thermoplasmata archaeon]